MEKEFQRILEKVARKNGTTPEEVYREMQIAIDEAFDRKGRDLNGVWDAIHFHGEKPTPEELVNSMVQLLSLPDSEL